MDDRQNITFQKLTPIDNADISVYEDAIEFSLKNDDITNVALSGPYSAGKSSIIETYKKKHPDKKFVHISLAHFECPEETDSDDSKKESWIEGKILNQLLHQIPVKRIPQTNFRIKKDMGKKDSKKLTVLISILLCSGAFLRISNKVPTIVEQIQEERIKQFLSVFTSGYAIIIATLLFVISAIICIHKIITVQKNKNLFRKISYQGNTIEIFETQNESYFDKYLNEVLYLFEQVEADVIVFEDMDRFDSNEIFVRLREVNNLTNFHKKKYLEENSESGEYKPLRFFFLLRDDIFTTKDRTKFFDYIIPVIPILDASNSYDKFISLMKKENLLTHFDASFLQRLSLYIDDMRVLKNIYNEFRIYMNRLNNTELQWDKMLAIIVYKNLFPRDFSDLQLGRGYVHELFGKKNYFSAKKKEILENEKQLLIEEIQKIDAELLNTIEELNVLYNVKYNNLPHNYGYSSLTSEGKKQWAIMENEKEARRHTIQSRINGDKLKYEKRIADIDHQLMVIKTQQLHELIDRDNADEIFMIKGSNVIGKTFEYKEIKGNSYFDLLKFLIRDGYIDETYNDYMTYFYEESISAHDKIFLRKITDKLGADFEYSLMDVKKVLESPVLREVDFSEEETLNFDLIYGILMQQDNPKYQKYLYTVIVQIKENHRFDFVAKFYDSGKFDSLFISKLNQQWPEFFSFAKISGKFSTEQIRRYSIDTLYYTDAPILQLVNVDNCLSEYISNEDDYLNIPNARIDTIISQLSLLQVSFISINYLKSEEKLFLAVYKNHLYDLSFENIKLMLQTQYGVDDTADITHKNYTLVQSMRNEPLVMYVNENINTYVGIILDNCEERIEDEEDCVIEILNNDAVEENLKKQYINYLFTNIYDLSKVKNTTLWSQLLTRQLVFISVDNIAHYFHNFGLDQVLIDTINNLNKPIDYSGMEQVYGSDITEQFFDKIIINNNINNNRYEEILNNLNYVLETFENSDISEEKVCILIKNHIIEMHVDALKYIRMYYPTLVMTFIDANVTSYLDILPQIDFNLDEALHVLDLDIGDPKKIAMLAYTADKIPIYNKKYSDELSAYIIKNNFDSSDAKVIYKNYSSYSNIMKNAIYEIAEDSINQIILDEDLILDDQLISDLITKSSYSIDIKIQLWASQLVYLNEETCKKHFDELGVPELKRIFTMRNVKRTYQKNPVVTKIFEVLKANGWIYKFSECKDDTDLYIVTKTGPLKK